MLKIDYEPHGPLTNTIQSITIRPDVTIHIPGIPFDLTTAEAKRITNIVNAYAVPTT